VAGMLAAEYDGTSQHHREAALTLFSALANSSRRLSSDNILHTRISLLRYTGGGDTAYGPWRPFPWSSVLYAEKMRSELDQC